MEEMERLVEERERGMEEKERELEEREKRRSITLTAITTVPESGVCVLPLDVSIWNVM